jgi:tRNA G10  N-methylase Trm11
METDKVVGRFKDGSLIKGKIHDFSIDKTKFNFETIQGERRKITVEELKAVFWVKDFQGNMNHKDKFNFELDLGGRRIRVRFFDGEVIIGHTIGYASNQPGFFMIPLDTACNNKGVFVIKSATEIIEFLDSQN